ncbi:unnamed protein product [Fusarium equiseti]|uniref:NACHT domain-containing protein n=1 Tax=Fusarium equiseti TaxID=61235 RepID=A0A8J2JIS9_FUSEQ|nr:unnamed protein product [Fusarium equiseti]
MLDQASVITSRSSIGENSIITDAAVEIICERCSELLQRNFYEVNAYLTQKIPANEVVLQEALQIVMGELSVKGLKPSQAKLATLIHGTMSQAVVHSAHSKFGMVVSQGVAVAAGSKAGSFLANISSPCRNHHYPYHDANQVDIAKTLHAFSPTDPRHDKKRIEDGNLLRDSYKWILDNEEFITWRDDSNGGRPLWIKGDPGKGKTMLLCGIINELQPYTKLSDSESHISLSYFFCQATISGLDNCTAVLKGLIYLLIAQQPCLVSYILDTQLPSSTHWNSRDAVEGIFDRIIADHCLQDTYMVVDALDECVDGLRYLLKLILNTRSRIKWIVSSRNRFDIDTFLGQTPANLHLSLELHEDCISQAVISYIDSRVDTLAARMRLKPELNQVVRQYLSEHARGTFLWVALVCKELERSKPWEIKKILSEIPEGLNELFTRMMDQILKSSSRDLYIRLLATTSIVFRPITFSELVAIEREMDINEDMLPAMVAECAANALRFLQSLPTTLSRTDGVAFVKDAFRFFLQFRPIIEDYPLQIYASGLLFSPQQSLVRRRFEAYIPEFLVATPQISTSWGPIWTILETSQWPGDIEFSSTSPMQVMMISPGEIVKWGVNDGSVHERTSYENASMIRPSPDLEWVALIIQGRTDNTECHVQDILQVRDVKMGSILWSREVGVSDVCKMTISSDSSSLAVCYHDRLELFTREGDMSQKWPIPPTLDIRGHEIAFSSDYALLMASLRLTQEFRVRVVDLRSGKEYDCPNPDLYGPVLDAKFIPGTYLVMLSASDSPLYLWNIFEQRIEEWIHHYDHSLIQIAFSNQGFWIAVATGTGLLLYDRRERVILKELELPNADETSLITFSPDDDKIAVRDEKRIWIVDMDSLLALDPAPATRGDSDFFISNSGRSVAYVAHDKIEIQDVSTGRALCTSSLEDVKGAGLDGLAFSPDDQHVALIRRPSIFSWNLTTAELQHTFIEPGYGRLLALSNKDNDGGQWIATDPSFRDVSVLNTTTGNRERWITPSDPVLEIPDALAFTSCHLGVLWCSRVLSPGSEPGSERGSENALFVLYNIRTGEQVSRFGDD